MKKRGKFKFKQMEPVKPPPSIRKKVGRAVELGIVSTVAKVVYITGLTVLIPFLPLIFAPEDFFMKALKTGSLITGVLFVAAGVSVVLATYKSKRSALITLGLFTFIPAVLAAAYAYWGSGIEKAISLTGPMEGYLTHWIDFYMPTAISVATVYFLIGLALLGSSYFWPPEPSASTHRYRHFPSPK
ncbi:hypothetical protein KY329_04075, partial [Candidatus Woesearchaeota archaeon]|nr:hypothetical protein [Candidatus Woesearchaeota archaeon]